jgi:hypothetical protein
MSEGLRELVHERLGGSRKCICPFTHTHGGKILMDCPVHGHPPAPAAPPVLQAEDPEKWPEMQCITFASIEDRKKCQQLINEMCREAERVAFEKAAQHEPQMYIKDGPISGVNGVYTIGFSGCTCGWNSDGEASKSKKWGDHIRALAEILGKEVSPETE